MKRDWTLKRVVLKPDVTLGILLDPENNPFCFTLEEPWKQNKRQISCIPTGTYKCKVYNSAKYQNVWEVTGVAGRDKILIHTGNTTKDIMGCILVGERFGRIDGLNAVLDSRAALSRLRMAINDDFTLTIKD
jgi:hypothetical protein